MSSGNGGILCNKCKGVFTGRSGVRKHRESKHGARAEYACDFCKNRWSEKGVIRRHKRKNDCKGDLVFKG